MKRACALFAASASAGLALAVAPPASAGTALDGVPHVQHAVILVLENESFASTWSPSSPATYLNGLVHQGAFVPQYYATGHVSLDNYIAMTSGLAGPQIAPTYTDCLSVNLYTCVQDVSAAAATGSIADQIEAAGLTWKQYADGTSAPCVHDSYSPTASRDNFQGDQAAPESSTANGDYADRHVPFLYYSSIIANGARCAAHLQPLTELRDDIRHDTVPSYAFITPDTCDDGHDSPCADGRPGGLTSADAFLRSTLPGLLGYLQAHDGVLFVTFDEASPSDPGGCCHGGPAGQRGFGGQVGLLALGPAVHAGYTSTQQYDHASLLRTVEDALGISTYLNNAAASAPMDDIWAAVAAAGPTAQPATVPVATAPAALPDASPAPTTMPAVAAVLGLVSLTWVRRRKR